MIRDFTERLSSGTRVAADVYGGRDHRGDETAGAGGSGGVGRQRGDEALRAKHRRERLERAIPAAEYKRRQRENAAGGRHPVPARAMYRDVMEVSPTWATEFRTFWDLPDDFEVPSEVPA